MQLSVGIVGPSVAPMRIDHYTIIVEFNVSSVSKENNAQALKSDPRKPNGYNNSPVWFIKHGFVLIRLIGRLIGFSAIPVTCNVSIVHCSEFSVGLTRKMTRGG